MAQATSIEWTDVSWNPVHGCSKVSPGCAHCYAETLSLRYSHTTRPWTPENAEHNVTLKPHKLREPLSKRAPWDKPCRVFVNSMSDLFHERVPRRYIDHVFAVMAWATQHTFQVLTKRPERMRAYLTADGVTNRIDNAMCALCCGTAPIANKQPGHGICGFPGEDCGLFGAETWPLSNVWLGVSIENRRFVGRADVLREVPAAVRFISAEPLLGPLIAPTIDTEVCEVDGRTYPVSQVSGAVDETWFEPRRDWSHGDDLDLTGVDWLIIGGESGPGHRPMRLEWARDLVAAAREAGCAPFVKQLGGARPGTALEDLPEDLRIREFPIHA